MRERGVRSPGTKAHWGTVAVMVPWLSGNTLLSISVVTLRRARLVLGWVTVYGKTY